MCNKRAGKFFVPLIEPEPRYSTKFLILLGVPSFILAVALSLCVHQYAHQAAKKYSCGAGTSGTSVVSIIERTDDASGCPTAALAGVSSTFIVAVLSFAFFLHHPKNIFFASMAFVNAASRLPETLTVLFQLLFHQQATIAVDESTALKLMHFKDPTAGVVLLFFYALTMIFLSLTIIHDTRIVPRKWLIALILFVGLAPLENLLWKFVPPLFP